MRNQEVYKVKTDLIDVAFVVGDAISPWISKAMKSVASSATETLVAIGLKLAGDLPPCHTQWQIAQF